MNAPERRGLQRGVIVLPSAFTLGNLFVGIWAVVSAARGNFELAAWLIVIAAVLDMLDGRIARFTRTGSDFGEQLDSLVDAVSFGVAPGLIIYYIFLADAGGWNWAISYIYVTAAIIRLARFNVEQSGHAKSAFHGLPSPTAGMSLATLYPFTQTGFYQRYLAEFELTQFVPGLVLMISILMVSHVLYPVVPRFSLRSRKGIFTLAIAILAIIAAFSVPALFFFPAAMVYITWGLLRSAWGGFMDRLPDRDPLLDEEEDEREPRRVLDYEEMHPRTRREPNRRTNID